MWSKATDRQIGPRKRAEKSKRASARFLCLRAAALRMFLPDSNAPCDHGLLQVHINGRKFPQHKCECFSTKVEYQPTTSGRVQ
jgi:hypothetical protein